MKIKTINTDHLKIDKNYLYTVKLNIPSLTLNIKKIGLISPIICIERKDGIFIVRGFRRFKSLKRLKTKKAPVIIIPQKNILELLKDSIIENSFIRGITLVEISNIYKNLRDNNLSEEEIFNFLKKELNINNYTFTIVKKLSDISYKEKLYLQIKKLDINGLWIYALLPYEFRKLFIEFIRKTKKKNLISKYGEILLDAHRKNISIHKISNLNTKEKDKTQEIEKVIQKKYGIPVKIEKEIERIVLYIKLTNKQRDNIQKAISHILENL